MQYDNYISTQIQYLRKGLRTRTIDKEMIELRCNNMINRLEELEFYAYVSNALKILDNKEK